MKTLEQVVAKGGNPNVIDGRDMSRIVRFLPVERWGEVGMKPSPEFKADEFTVLPFTEEEVKKQLANDLAFGFEKALNQRGISSGLMYGVVKMWLWVLDDPLADFTAYAQYGLPLFKAVAIKYNLPNPIGDKAGNEPEFASD